MEVGEEDEGEGDEGGGEEEKGERSEIGFEKGGDKKDSRIKGEKGGGDE